MNGGETNEEINCYAFEWGYGSFTYGSTNAGIGSYRNSNHQIGP